MSKKCSKCGYKWDGRVPHPKNCPRCKARLDLTWSRICKHCRKVIKENQEHSVHGSHTDKLGRVYPHYYHWNCVRKIWRERKKTCR